MRIDAVHARRFGAFRDFSIGGFGDAALIVVSGPNEAGKTTLVELIETALYGFDPPRLDKHPRATGDALHLRVAFKTANGRILEVERTLAGTATGRVTVGGVVREIGNAPLDHVASVPRDIYRRLHRVAVDEASDAAGWHRAEARILGGGTTSPVRSPVAVADELEREARASWREDRRGKPRARALAGDLERLRARRDVRAAEVRRLRDLGARRRDLRARLDELEAEVLVARRGLEAARAADEARERAEVARTTLSRIRRTLRADLDELTAAVGECEGERGMAEQALARRAASLVDQADDLAARILRTPAFPSEPAAMPTIYWLAAAVPALFGGIPGWSTAGGAISILLASTALRRRRHDLAVDVALAGAGLTRCAGMATLREGWPELAGAARQVLRCAQGVKAARSRRRSRIASMREVLVSARGAFMAESERFRSVGSSAPVSVARAAQRLEDAEVAHSQTARDLIRYGEEADRLEAGESLAAIDGETLALTAELEECKVRRDRLMLAAAALREADRRLRSRVRPRMIEAASRSFAIITGDDRRLMVEDCESGPRLWMRPPGRAGAIALDHASRGTREQALLALRLALIERAEDDVQLPMILDDALAAWDPARRRTAATLLARVATTRQLLLLTPQPEVAAAFRGVPGARIVDLARLVGARAATSP